MTDWPPDDCDPAVYEPPRVPRPAATPLVQRAHVAAKPAEAGETPVAFSPEQTAALMERLHRDGKDLAEQGVFLSMYGPHPQHGLSIHFRGWDAAAGERTLRERYGAAIRVEYTGAAARRLQPVPFASWLAEGDRLHVFYGLPHNSERPIGAQVIERDDSVIIGVRIDAPRGFATLVGGFIPSHATVELAAPLGDRVVIDDTADVVRPHWTQVPPSPPGRFPPRGPGRGPR
jgi:hypothetical protein